MKSIFILPAAISGCLLLLTGCIFPEYRNINNYSLDVEPVAGSGKLYVAVMRNVSGSGCRIQSRSVFEIKQDPYNLWHQEPGALVTCALNRALCRDGITPATALRGELECFEADIPDRVFRLSGFYAKVPSGKRIRFDITTPLRGTSTENIVLAASEAVRKLAVRMAEQKL